MNRSVEHSIPGQATSDGAGVKLTRLLQNTLQQRLDPFLMLDAFGSDNPNDYIAGFPNHPHRGFETMTYMLKGRMLHQDSAGNEGLLEDGGMQWMSAARGVIHSEIPQQENGVMAGFQLWINLPAVHKMDDPWYRDFQRDDLPSYSTEHGVKVIVLAGQSQDTNGAVTRPITQPLVLDLHLPAHAPFSHPVPATHNAFLVVYEGTVTLNGQELTPHHLVILANDGDHVQLHASQDAKVLLVAGQPLNEPIVQYGPFVMNTNEQIQQAVHDFRAGTLTR
ncbi:hypothetical protein PAEH1_08720 [Paenalcaligenes hominis]|uniref:Quercetin 2,3-dioxygenase n=1 Tax=Paenalcaligenes hominis TaxID=643674 RepID=A0A1U9K0W2_9BURK|nr:pirin family protein [Paenalcaligenes hominis]AQS51624.1 hypothetical protein PAEH1_08720 [Paenalcaligenes hominis]